MFIMFHLSFKEMEFHLVSKFGSAIFKHNLITFNMKLNGNNSLLRLALHGKWQLILIFQILEGMLTRIAGYYFHSYFEMAYRGTVHPDVYIQVTTLRLSTSILYHHALRTGIYFSSQHFITTFHHNISSQHFITTFHHNISSQQFITTFHHNISSQHFITTVHHNSSSQHFITFH